MRLRFEMDESEESDDPRRGDPFGDTEKFARFNYADIMRHGSDELKRAVEIVLGGKPPAVYTKEESA